jgi:hypothetical protein
MIPISSNIEIYEVETKRFSHFQSKLKITYQFPYIAFNTIIISLALILEMKYEENINPLIMFIIDMIFEPFSISLKLKD